MKSVVEIFKEISQISHCSFKSVDLKRYIIDFARSFNYIVEIDRSDNILCFKGEPLIALQAHYDMVCIGNAPKLELIIDDNIIRAKESSLGADNGVGVAIMLYMMQHAYHFEALFTNNEEVGLLGAVNLKLNLNSKQLLNLDSEEEGDIFVGCAGGVDIIATKKIKKAKLKLKDNLNFYKIITSGRGGHSGIDIDKDIDNALKTLISYLSDKKVKLISLNGGEKINSIPKEAVAIVATKENLESLVDIKVKKVDEKYDEYIKESKKIIEFLNSFSQGVRSFDRELKIPKDSINLSLLNIKKGKLKIEFFARSMSNEGLEKLMSETNSHLNLLKFKTKYKNQFPAWSPEITDFTENIKKLSKKYFKKPKIKAIHAGLECGVIKDKFHNLKVASIGPNIFHPHSTNEYCEIDSIERVTKLVEDVLKLYS